METEIPKEILEMILSNYEDRNAESMGHLHNRFVGFISESKLPITHVITVLQLLLIEATQMAHQKYVGGS